jgi:NAD(P)-dependent dehydrogenase (short-subunit alcohol dehydrogenase family)
MSDPSDSRVWLITGTSSGFGWALARHVLAQGERVIATARRLDALSELSREFPGQCWCLALDVSDPGQVRAVVSEAAAAFGRLDVIVNNAGYAVAGALEELSAEEVAANFATNFFGALEVIRAALPTLRAQNRGHIVNISAAAAISNYPGFSIYGASKWALEGASESLAAELKPFGIHVTLVQPGPFRTGFIGRSLRPAAHAMPEYDRSSGKFLKFLQTMEGKQPGDPERAAAAIFAAVDSPTPPLRLVLGKYAQEKVRKKLAATQAELEKWQDIGLATEFPPGT